VLTAELLDLNYDPVVYTPGDNDAARHSEAYSLSPALLQRLAASGARVVLAEFLWEARMFMPHGDCGAHPQSLLLVKTGMLVLRAYLRVRCRCHVGGSLRPGLASCSRCICEARVIKLHGDCSVECSRCASWKDAPPTCTPTAPRRPWTPRGGLACSSCLCLTCVLHLPACFLPLFDGRVEMILQDLESVGAILPNGTLDRGKLEALTPAACVALREANAANAAARAGFAQP
jgi:hypothetical protein